MQNVAVNGPQCHSKVSFPIVSKSIWPSRITDVTNRKLYATKYNVEMKLHNVCFYIFNISVHGKEFYFCQDMYFFVSVCSGLETRPRGFPAVGKVIEEQPQLLRPEPRLLYRGHASHSCSRKLVSLAGKLKQVHLGAMGLLC